MLTPATPEAKTLEEARLQARVWYRAQKLDEEGYCATFLTEDVLEVSGPNGGPYRIDTMGRTCDCPFFAENGFCKHWWGWPCLVSGRIDDDGKEGAPSCASSSA